MNVAGGKGCQCGDLPVFISALRADSIAAKNGKIQVSVCVCLVCSVHGCVCVWAIRRACVCMWVCICVIRLYRRWGDVYNQSGVHCRWIQTPPLAAYTSTHTCTLLLAFFPLLNLQEGDILLSINGNSLLGRTHLEAIQTIKSVMSATTVRMELIQVSAALVN